jgi:hypothetical protein
MFVYKRKDGEAVSPIGHEESEIVSLVGHDQLETINPFGHANLKIVSPLRHGNLNAVNLMGNEPIEDMVMKCGVMRHIVEWRKQICNETYRVWKRKRRKRS